MAGYAVLALSYVMSQFFRAFLAVLTPLLGAELGMTKSTLGLASGVFFITFALAQFTVGSMLDQRGPRLTAGIIFPIFAGGGALLFSLAQSSTAVVVAMGLLGIGCSPVLMASYFLFARENSAQRFAVFSSWLVAFGTVGNIAGTAPLAFAVGHFGWRMVMAGLSMTSVIIGLAILALVKRDAMAPKTSGSGYSGYVELLKLRVLWPLIPLMLIAYMPPAGIRGLWAGPYLHDLFSATPATIGNITFFMALSMAAGSFLYGIASQLFGSVKTVIIGGNLVQLCALAALAILSFATPLTPAILFAIVGGFGLTYGLQMSHARGLMPEYLAGRGVALMNFFAIIGVGMMQIAGGGLLDGAKASSPQSAYAMMFLAYAAMLVVSLVAFTFSKELPNEATR
jgi:MFS family permease